MSSIVIRSAKASDNNQLQALCQVVPFMGDTLSYHMLRSPKYDALSQIQGTDYRILVAEDEGQLLGSMTVIVDQVYINKNPQKVAYTADLKLRPEARGKGIADQLMKASVDLIQNLFDTPMPIYTCVMTDNPRGLKKNQNLGKSNVTQMSPIGKINGYFLLPFDTSFKKTRRYKIEVLKSEERPELTKFWSQYAKDKHLARSYQKRDWPVFKDLTFLVARNQENEMVGCLGLWNQKSLRQIILTDESLAIKSVRKTWNAIASKTQIPSFPVQGEPLPLIHGLHLCIAPFAPKALPALIKQAFIEIKKQKGILLGLALDAQDPLNLQMKPFLHSVTPLHLLSNDEHLKVNKRGLFQVEMALG